MRTRIIVWNDTVLRVSDDVTYVYVKPFGSVTPGVARRLANALNDAADEADRNKKKYAKPLVLKK